MKSRFHKVWVILAVIGLLLPFTTSISSAKDIPLDKTEILAAEQGPRIASEQVSWTAHGKLWWAYEEKAPYSALADVNVEDSNLVLIDDIVTIDIRDVARSISAIPQDLLSGQPFGSPDQYYLIKFSGPIYQEWLDQLKGLDVRLFTYYKWFTYAARIPPASLEQVQALPFITWIGLYEPAYKIDNRIGLIKHPPEAVQAGQPFVLEVSFFEDQEMAKAETIVTRMGGTVIDRIHNSFQLILITSIQGELIPELAKNPAVKYILEWAEPTLKYSPNNVENPVVLQVGPFDNTATGLPYRSRGLDGTGQVIAMMDTGLDVASIYFAHTTAGAGTVGPAHRKVYSYAAYGGGDLCNCSNVDPQMSHGTWTTCMALGRISPLIANEKYDFGVARAAKVAFQDISPNSSCAAGETINPPADLTTSMTDAMASTAFVQSHSWGAANNSYSAHTGQLDSFLFSNRNFMVTVAAGNSGMSSLDGNLDDLATGKNLIAVGGNDQDPNQNRLFADTAWGLGSGRGPVTSSNRTKPDLLFVMADSAGTAGNASGENMAGPVYVSHCSPWTGTPATQFVPDSGLGGTSFSTPMVAGAAAVIRQYFIDGWYPTGAAVPANSMTPNGPLIKAMLIASAQNMDTVDSPNGNPVARRYSSDVGYGRVQLNKVLPIAGAGVGPTVLSVVNNKSLTTGNTDTTNYIISSNAEDVKVALAWYDKSGNTLQIDYDLEVTLGSVYKGNQFNAAGWSTASGTVDHTNSTEAVFLQTGAFSPGYMTVKVYAYNAPSGDSPTYSLVVLGAIAPPGTKGIYINKDMFDCDDTMGLTVIDEGAGSSVAVTITTTNGDTETLNISGTAPAYNTTIPVSGSAVVTQNGIVNIIDAATITASYTDSGSTLRTDTAAGKCYYNVCFYFLDELSGGCDDDPYQDQGERLNYWVAMRNSDTVPTGQGFYASLRTKAGSDPNGYFTILNDTAYFPAIDPTRAAYLELPFFVEYTGPIGSTCDTMGTFEIYDVISEDGTSWTAPNCGAANEFTERLNWDYGPTVISQTFETWPLTGWTITSTGDCPWGSNVASERPNYTGGNGMCADADSDFCGEGTTMNTTLTTPTFSLSGVTAAMLEFKTSFDDYSGTTVADIDISTDGGTGWTNIEKYVAADAGTEGKFQIDLTPYVGSATTLIRFHYTTGAWEWFWELDDVRVYAGPQACETTVCSPSPNLYVEDWEFVDTDCNANGWIDAGEVNELTIWIDNDGSDWATETTATLSTTTPGVSVCDNSAAYGTLPNNPDNWIWGAGLNYFTIAVDSSVNCVDHPGIDFDITFTSSNPYTVTRSFTLPLGSFQPMNLYYQEMCGLEPETAGATGRTGFNTAWNVSTNNRLNRVTGTTSCSDDGNGYIWTGTNSVTADHRFSTVGATQEVYIQWNWDIGQVATSRTLEIFYTTNCADEACTGATWTSMATEAGGGGSAADWSCWSGGVYATTGNAAVLNNPNFGIRFFMPAAGQMDNFRLRGYDTHCTATTCTGECPATSNPPPMPGNGVSGSPFTIAKNAGITDNVDFTWDGTTCTAPNYQVIWGNLNTLNLVGNVTHGTVTSANCNLSGSAIANQTSPVPAAGECFFAIIDAVNGSNFGRHGDNSFAQERVFSGDITVCSGVSTKDTTLTSCAKAVSGIKEKLGNASKVREVQTPNTKSSAHSSLNQSSKNSNSSLQNQKLHRVE